MATHLSTYFRQQRLQLGLRLGDVARRMGYKSIDGTANKIILFEERGDILADLFEKLAAVLSIDEATIQRLIERDRREFVERWNKWADEPITPHLVVRVIPGTYFEEEIAEGVRTTEAMEEYAADYARRMHKKVWLVLSRRLTIYFKEDGTKDVQKAVPGRCNSPYMCLGGSKQKFIFTGGMQMRPLNEPEQHGPK
jgi:transcriptional regulator with XRE-family HTH domain